MNYHLKLMNIYKYQDTKLNSLHENGFKFNPSISNTEHRVRRFISKERKKYDTSQIKPLQQDS